MELIGERGREREESETEIGLTAPCHQPSLGIRAITYPAWQVHTYREHQGQWRGGGRRWGEEVKRGDGGCKKSAERQR